MNKVSITGPVSYTILKNVNSERIVYLFADHHFSISGGCSQACDAPDFTFEKIIKRDSDCWTITAMLHEVLTHFGAKGETVNFYLEASAHGGQYKKLLKELSLRRNGMVEKPRSREQVELLRQRLAKERYHWINDIYNMVHDKDYGRAVRVIQADARLWHGKRLVPVIIPGEGNALQSSFAETVEAFLMTQDEDAYQQSIDEILNDLEDLAAIVEQLIAEPYLLLRQYFEPIDFAASTRMLINYIPTESQLGARIASDLRNALERSYGVRNSKGQLASLSAVAWTRLRKVNPEMATKLNDYIQEDLEGKKYHYVEHVLKVSDLLANENLRDPNNLPYLVSSFKQLNTFIQSSILITSSVMDYYILSEILRSDAKHSIVYAGEAHINNCVGFLRTVGFEVLEEQPVSYLADGSVSRCVSSVLLGDLLELREARALF